MIEKIPSLKVGDKIRAMIVGWGKKGNPFVKVKGFVVYIEKFEDKTLKIKELLNLRVTKIFSSLWIISKFNPLNISLSFLSHALNFISLVIFPPLAFYVWHL